MRKFVILPDGSILTEAEIKNYTENRDPQEKAEIVDFDHGGEG